jgi:hypothetical protein
MGSTGQDFSIHQGVHRVISVAVSGTNAGTAAAIKWVLADSAGAPLISKTLAGGGVVNATAASFDVLLFPSDTADIPPGEYVHEARVTDEDSQQDVVCSGVVSVWGSVSK